MSIPMEASETVDAALVCLACLPVARGRPSLSVGRWNRVMSLRLISKLPGEVEQIGGSQI